MTQIVEMSSVKRQFRIDLAFLYRRYYAKCQPMLEASEDWVRGTLLNGYAYLQDPNEAYPGMGDQPMRDKEILEWIKMLMEEIK